MWCWRWIKRISWTNCVRSEEINEMKWLQRVKEERNILHTVTRRKGNWIGHILHRNCLLKHIIEGNIERKIEMMWRWVRWWCKQLLDDLKEKIRYWKLKEEVLACTLWRTGCGRGYGPVTRETTECMNGSSCTTLVHGIQGCWQVLSPTYFRCILFDGENILFDASLVIYI